MKLIKINTSKLDKSLYGFGGVRFTIGMKPVNKFVDTIFPFQGCRENVCARIRQEFTSKRKIVRIDEKRTRLLIYARFPVGAHLNKKDKEEFCATKHEEFHKQMIISQKLVNHWEEKLGWFLTKLYKVDSEGDVQSGLYMVVGSPKWQKTPHYLSLYMLMLRLGRSGFKDGPWDTHDAVMKRLKAFGRTTCNDAGYIKQTIPKWDVFLANQGKLVGKKSMKDMFSKTRLAHRDNGNSEGIACLCSGGSFDLLFSYKFQDICRRAGIYQRVSCTPDLKLIGGMK